MISKSLIPVLVLFLIAVIAFFALQLINIFTQEPLPEVQTQTQKLDPSLNTKILNDLRSSPQFN